MGWGRGSGAAAQGSRIKGYCKFSGKMNILNEKKLSLNFKLLVKIKGNSVNDCDSAPPPAPSSVVIHARGGHCYCSPWASSDPATLLFRCHHVPRAPHEARPVFLYTGGSFSEDSAALAYTDHACLVPSLECVDLYLLSADVMMAR